MVCWLRFKFSCGFAWGLNHVIYKAHFTQGDQGQCSTQYRAFLLVQKLKLAPSPSKGFSLRVQGWNRKLLGHLLGLLFRKSFVRWALRVLAFGSTLLLFEDDDAHFQSSSTFTLLHFYTKNQLLTRVLFSPIPLRICSIQIPNKTWKLHGSRSSQNFFFRLMKL
jgi:hypothetical protein